MSQSETIVAPATPQGKSALAVLRLSGKDSIAVTAECIAEKARFLSTPSRTISLYTAKNYPSGKNIDQITCIKYNAPRSFTGEDMVEIICHGGGIIIQEIFESLVRAGAKSATGGEFTRRALNNGKIDIMKAEGIGALIESTGKNELLCANKLYSGKANALALWREKVLVLLEKIENKIEFEESPSNMDEKGKKTVEDFLVRLKGDLERIEKIRIVDKGLNVVIAGPVNAGKSTLFNAIIGKNRAIVHREPGTTRDIVSERLWLHGHEIQLFDSAGIRKTDYEIEREGIERSREAMRDAGIIIWVTAADEKITSAELKELDSNRETTDLVCVINKIDMCDGGKKAAAIKKRGIKTVLMSMKEERKGKTEELLAIIIKKIEEIQKDTDLPEMLFNARHEEIGRILFRELSMAREEWERPEVAALYLKKGLSCMDEYYGTVNAEEVLNGIFKNFCIGK